MEKLFLTTYIVNAVFLINHEIDSAYWQEWKLFHLKGGVTMFLALHFPLAAVILIGLVEVYALTLAGAVFSLVLGFGGIFAMAVHRYFIKKGHVEFTTGISQFILWGTFLVSLFQIGLGIYMIVKDRV